MWSCLGPSGKYSLANGSNTIKVFTKEGVYICQNVCRFLNHPSVIAIGDEGYSLVSEYDGHCLSIYHPEGNMIHTVGNLKNPLHAWVLH